MHTISSVVYEGVFAGAGSKAICCSIYHITFSTLTPSEHVAAIFGAVILRPGKVKDGMARCIFVHCSIPLLYQHDKSAPRLHRTLRSALFSLSCNLLSLPEHRSSVVKVSIVIVFLNMPGLSLRLDGMIGATYLRWPMAVITHFEKRYIYRTRPLLESFVPNNFVSNLTMTCHSVLRDRVRVKSPSQVKAVIVTT